MSVHGLWGVPAPDPGTASRAPAGGGVDRTVTPWAPAKSLRGVLSQEMGVLARTVVRASQGVYSERIHFLESYSAFGSLNLRSFSMMVEPLEAYDAVANKLRPYVELTGYRESYQTLKAGRGIFSEWFSYKESYIGMPSPTGGSTFGSYGERIGYFDSYTGRKSLRSSYAERVQYLESYIGLRGPDQPPPPPGELSDVPLATRIGSPYMADLIERIGPKPT